MTPAIFTLSAAIFLFIVAGLLTLACAGDRLSPVLVWVAAGLFTGAACAYGLLGGLS